jgi:hypothetical protein
MWIVALVGLQWTNIETAGALAEAGCDAEPDERAGRAVPLADAAAARCEHPDSREQGRPTLSRPPALRNSSASPRGSGRAPQGRPTRLIGQLHRHDAHKQDYSPHGGAAEDPQIERGRSASCARRSRPRLASRAVSELVFAFGFATGRRLEGVFERTSCPNSRATPRKAPAGDSDASASGAKRPRSSAWRAAREELGR